MINLFTKNHQTEKILTFQGMFLGLSRNQSTRNLEVGDYFCIFENKKDLLIFIQKEWHNIWFLDISNDQVVGEIEYNILTDKSTVKSATLPFKKLYKNELKNLKKQLKFS